MTESTEKLIKELADKFGTTTEHLWGVLLKQATITGIVDLSILLDMVAITVFLFRFIYRKTTAQGANTYPDWDGDGAGVAWFLWALLPVSTFIFIAVNLSMMAAALFNPEYWALKQILK